jgi:hypothetical protein
MPVPSATLSEMTPGNYFFVHIPKTAGTSFRVALGKNGSVRMLFDYGKKNPESSPELMALRAQEVTPELEIFHAGKLNFICGHVNYRKYRHCVQPDGVISIARNPVERVVSEYQHLRRHNGLSADFTAFFETPVQQNKQWRMLRGLRARSGGLVGLTSHYGVFLEVASRRLGIPLNFAAVNEAPAADAEGRVRITPREIKAAFAHNGRDRDVFFEHARAFAERVRDIGYRTVPPGNADWSCRIDEGGRVVGWVSRGANDCYFVVIGVNGEPWAIVALDQERRDVQERGLSEHPVCGFVYPLALTGAEPGDEVSVRVLGAPGLEKTLSA